MDELVVVSVVTVDASVVDEVVIEVDDEVVTVDVSLVNVVVKMVIVSVVTVDT